MKKTRSIHSTFGIQFIVLATIFLLSTRPVYATTITVSPGESIQTTCLNVVQPGDTCVINAGTYNEALKLKTSGTQSSPITLICATPKGCTINSGTNKTLVTSNHTHYYTIEGFRFIATGVTDHATLYFGEGTTWSKNDKTLGNNGYIFRNNYVEGNILFYGHDNLVERCELNGKNIWNDGITDWYASSYNNTYRNNKIYDYKVRSIWTMQYTDNILIEGNDVNNHIDCDGAGHPVTRCIVKNNYIHDAGMGIQIENSFDSVFEGNHIANVDTFGMIIENYGKSADFNADAEYRNTISNITVKNNLIYNPGSNGIYIYGASGGIIENNTVVYSKPSAGYYGALALARYDTFLSHDWVIKHNIFSSQNVSALVTTSTSPLPNMTIDYNLYEGSKFYQRIDSTFTPKTTAQWQAFGYDQHSVFANPLFKDVSTSNYQLASNSPACAGGERGHYIGAFPCAQILPTPTPAQSPTPTLRPLSTPSPTPTLRPSQTPYPTPTPTRTPKPGDANNDYVVDDKDYIVWHDHFGQSVSGASNGDFKTDGKVDGQDYIIWLNNFGK